MKRFLTVLSAVVLTLPSVLFPEVLQEINIGIDARAAAMGNASAAFAEGSRAVNLNPAGLAKTKNLMIGASFNSWFLDMSLQEVNVAMPAGMGAWGADFVFVNMGEFEMLDDYGNPTGETARPFTVQLTGGYGVPVMSYYEKIGDKIPLLSMLLGVSGKYIIRNIDGEIAQAFSLDAGMKLEIAGNLNFAVTLKNLSVTPFMDLPSALLVGLAGNVFSDVQHRVNAAFNLNQQMEGGAKFNFGLEYGFSELFFVRTGYEHDPSLKLPEGTFSGLSLGTGIVMQKMCLDYAFVMKGAAGNSQVVSIGYKF